MGLKGLGIGVCSRYDSLVMGGCSIGLLGEMGLELFGENMYVSKFYVCTHGSGLHAQDFACRASRPRVKKN